MAQLTVAAFLSKWASLFADNSNRDISEQDMRDFREDISDSFLNRMDGGSVLGDVVIGATSPSILTDRKGLSIDNPNNGGFLDIKRNGSTAIRLITDSTLISSIQSTNDLRFLTASSERFRITTDGRIYGTSLHNNAGAVTGTTNQYICSGTYTPTLTGQVNVDSTSAFTCQYMRVGNVVTVSGRLNVDPTVTTSTTRVSISLPIASAFADGNSCSGTAISTGGTGRGYIKTNITNGAADLEFLSTGTTSDTYFFTFTYLIV